MQQRKPELTRFLDSLHLGIQAQAAQDSAARIVTEKIMTALQTPANAAVPKQQQLPLCASLHGILDKLTGENSPATQTAAEHPHIASHAQAMKALSTSLGWWARPDAAEVGEPFASGHANAMVVGPGGLEERDDVLIGISFIAPNVRYPDHHHPPEEVYLVLSPGQWWQDNGSWHEPGVGGIVHNPPGILHAMQSGNQPLLATWCLWVD